MEEQKRTPILSAASRWLSLEIIIIFFVILIYAILVWRHVSPEYTETMDIVMFTFGHVSTTGFLMLIGVAGLFEIGGVLMLRFTVAVENARAEGKAEGIVEGIVEGKAEGKAEGIVEGKAEVYQEWHADWERRRKEAEEKGIPFTDPPPPNPETNNRKP